MRAQGNWVERCKYVIGIIHMEQPAGRLTGDPTPSCSLLGRGEGLRPHALESGGGVSKCWTLEGPLQTPALRSCLAVQ